MITAGSWQPVREQLPPPAATFAAATTVSVIGRSAGQAEARTVSGKTSA